MVVEAGALDGTTNSVGWFFEKTLKWKTYNIEPNSISFAMCELTRPDCVNVNAALSDEAGFATLEVPKKPGHGTIAGTSFRGKTVTEEVRTITWADFVSEYGVEKVDLLILDVEGHEMAVVSGMKGCEVLPEVICAETNKTSAADLEVALAPMGYEIAGTYLVNTFFERTRVREIDS